MAKRILAQQLIEKMRTRTGLSTAENKKVIETFLDMVMEKVAEGNSVQIKNFGTFTYVKRNNIITRNVVTGEELEPMNTAFTSFRSSPLFKEKIKAKVEQQPIDEVDNINQNRPSTAIKVTKAKTTATAKATVNGSTKKKTPTKKTSTASKTIIPKKEVTESTATIADSAKKKISTKKASTASKTIIPKKEITESKATIADSAKKKTSTKKASTVSKTIIPKKEITESKATIADSAKKKTSTTKTPAEAKTPKKRVRRTK